MFITNVGFNMNSVFDLPISRRPGPRSIRAKSPVEGPRRGTLAEQPWRSGSLGAFFLFRRGLSIGVPAHQPLPRRFKPGAKGECVV